MKQRSPSICNNHHVLSCNATLSRLVFYIIIYGENIESAMTEQIVAIDSKPKYI